MPYAAGWHTALWDRKTVTFLEANPKVGYVLESVPVRINKTLFCLKGDALNSSKEMGAKKRGRYKAWGKDFLFPRKFKAVALTQRPL